MKPKIKGYFSGDNQNINSYYLMSVAINCFFIASNWIYFWTKFMTYGQLGWVDALGFGFALLLEIPSGAIADLIGKKRTIQIGFIGGVIGTLLVATTNSLSQLFIGWMIAQIAYSFYSGAAEALVYDSLKETGREKEYDKIISKGESISLYAGAVSTFIGGFLYQYSFRLPHLLWSFSFFFRYLISLLLKEPKVDSFKFSFTNYFNQLKNGTKELFVPQLRKYLIFFFVLSGFYYMYSWGFIRSAIATSFGFFAKEQGIIYPILTLIGASSIRVMPYLRKHISDYMGLVILSVLMATSFIVATPTIGYYGMIPMLFIAIAGNFSRPWLSIIVNQKIPSQYRATTLSAAALINRIPYVFVAITAGKMIQDNKLYLLNISLGALIIIGLIMSYLVLSIFNKKTLPHEIHS